MDITFGIDFLFLSAPDRTDDVGSHVGRYVWDGTMLGGVTMLRDGTMLGQSMVPCLGMGP